MIPNIREMEIKEESMALGIELGRELGIKQGVQEMQYDMAKKLLTLLSDQEIAQATGLAVEQVTNLRTMQTESLNEF